MSNNYGWTAQSQHGWVHEEGVPGNTFTEDQLPNPDIQRMAGIDPDKYRSETGLWVEPAEQEQPQFIGTETGLTPAEINMRNLPHESFQSYYAEPDSE